MKYKQNISDLIREYSSISEVAEKYGISRPTLYRYMDLYDSEEYEKIPERLLVYFNILMNGDNPQGESEIYLKAESKRREEQLVRHKLAEVESDIDTRLREIRINQAATKSRWSDDFIQSICVPIPGGATVFVKNGVNTDFTLLVYIDVDGGRSLIGRYAPLQGTAYVTVRDLPPGMDYTYSIESADCNLTKPLRFVIG